MITKEALNELYWGKGFSQRQIAKILHRHPDTVRLWMKKYGLIARKTSEAVRLNAPWRGKKLPEEAKEKMSKVRKGRVVWHKGRTGVYKPEHLEKFSQRAKERWMREEYREKMTAAIIKGTHKRPNKQEKKMIDIIERNHLPFKYVGCGEVVLGGRCPDFMNLNGGKEVIELFSNYWHSPLYNQAVTERRMVEGTMRHYENYGFKCLVIWDSELSNEALVSEKIRSWSRS